MRAHWLDKGGDISPDDLVRHGVYFASLTVQPDAYREPLDRVKTDRGYVAEDIVELRPETPNLETICAKFVDEHFHDDDEVRFVLEGRGIFDIRSEDDDWMRVVVEPGDLIIVPEKRHHRFMLTDEKNIRCVRLFKDSSGWVPHYRASA